MEQHQMLKMFRYLLWIIIISLSGLCMAGHLNRTGASTSEDHRHPQASQLELLSLGQKQLFSDLRESSTRLDKQDSLVTLELDVLMRVLEKIQREGKQVRRVNTQVRADLQFLTAREERFQTLALRLRDELSALKTSHDGAAQRIRKLLAVVLLLSGSNSQTHSPVNTTRLKKRLDSQSKKLSSLSQELTTQDELLLKHQKDIINLEQQVTDQEA